MLGRKMRKKQEAWLRAAWVTIHGDRESRLRWALEARGRAPSSPPGQNGLPGRSFQFLLPTPALWGPLGPGIYLGRGEVMAVWAGRLFGGIVGGGRNLRGQPDLGSLPALHSLAVELGARDPYACFQNRTHLPQKRAAGIRHTIATVGCCDSPDSYCSLRTVNGNTE